MINDHILTELYNRQEKTPEKLPGTADLIRLSDQYRLTAHQNEWASNEELLARLLDLRKSGKLPRKTDRNLGKPKPQVWPSLSEMKKLDGKPYYRIAIEIDVTIEHIVYVLYDALCLGKPEPLSRAEMFVLLQQSIQHAIINKRKDLQYLDKAWAITRRLFPEMEG